MKRINDILIGLVVAVMDCVAAIALRFVPCAFDSSDMNRLSAGTTTLYLYKTADAVATVIASGYFSGYVDILKENDVIIAVCSTGGTQTIDVLVVSSADNATPVTVINGT